jgi:hypothetical protein
MPARGRKVPEIEKKKSAFEKVELRNKRPSSLTKKKPTLRRRIPTLGREKDSILLGKAELGGK